jgi:hypothetical protein
VKSSGTAILLDNQLTPTTIAPSPNPNHYIYNNIVSDTHTIGIALIGINNSLVEKNTLTMPGLADAISLTGSSKNTIKNNTISGGRTY